MPRKLIESTIITLDGVISNPQHYSAPYWDDDHAAYANELMAGADALVLGRETYEGFAQAWPSRSGDPFTDKINAMPKYVASRTLPRRPGTRPSSRATPSRRSPRSSRSRARTS